MEEDYLAAGLGRPIPTFLLGNPPLCVKRYGGTIPPYSETKRFVNQIMQEYNRLKTNPDPAIAKVKSAKAPMPAQKADIKAATKPIDLPDLREIPEVKHSEPVMEIL